MTVFQWLVVIGIVVGIGSLWGIARALEGIRDELKQVRQALETRNEQDRSSDRRHLGL